MGALIMPLWGSHLEFFFSVLLLLFENIPLSLETRNHRVTNLCIPPSPVANYNNKITQSIQPTLGSHVNARNIKVGRFISFDVLGIGGGMGN